MTPEASADDAARNAALLAWYRQHGRHALPWRRDPSPYRVLVSEFMLQQTQVDRVVPVFEAFVARFPGFAALAAAPAADVVRAWKGLGYNARAIRLHRVAQAVVERYAGELPPDPPALRSLGGIGAYTAAAIRAFAFGLDDVALDTNLRRIAHRVRFGVEVPARATPREVDAAAHAMLAAGDAFAWNSAMMDLGATLCTARAPKCLLCPIRAACAAAPIDGARLAALQRAEAPTGPRTPFARTDRFARGRIVDYLRALPPERTVSLLDLHAALRDSLGERTAADVAALVGSLEREGLIRRVGEQVRLP